MTPGSVNVDWLDPARESCLIDGVRYRRDAEAGDRILLATDGLHYVSEGTGESVLRDRGRTWWNVEAILVPIDQHPEGGET